MDRTVSGVMIPHTLVLGRGLEICKVYNGYYYWGRPSMPELHGDLREVGQRTYRDWDITDPELKGKWETGDKTNFYPYGDEAMSMGRLMPQMAGAVDQYARRAQSE